MTAVAQELTVSVNTHTYYWPLFNVPITSTLYVPASETVAADQSNDLSVGLKTKNVGRAAAVVVICAVYEYIASVQTCPRAKSENVIEVIYEGTPTLYV